MNLIKSKTGIIIKLSLCFIHLALLFLGPWLAMNVIFNTAITKELSKGFGSDIPHVLFMFSLIACVFLVLKNSFSVANFYLGHSIVDLFRNARQTIDYLVMIFSPVMYISFVFITDKTQLKYEFLDFGLNILAAQHLASYISYTKVAYEKRRVKDPGRAYGFASILFGIFAITSLSIASAGLYLVYVYMETSLAWRIVFNVFLLAGLYGSLRFFLSHADELWAARKEMD